ncbi:MAG TPA: hypothetical protein VL294_09940 [Pseudolysinimonas sp.]|nr:hypothetical protein [Pseudolysinimonas sp.]
MTATLERPESRIEAVHRRRREQTDRFPRTTAARWLVRLGFFVLFAVQPVLSAPALAGLNTPNQRLLDRIAAIDWNRADMTWLGDIFPPLSTLIAAGLAWGGRLALSLFGVAAAAIFLQMLLEIMVQRRFPAAIGGVLLVALSVNPLFAYTVTENLPAFLGLAFFALGISDVARFFSWGSTQSGFRAGLLLMLAVLCDPSALLYVAAAAATAPFIRLRRQGQPGARAANLLVIVYPTVAALAAIIALNLIFLGRPLAGQAEHLLDGAGDRVSALGQIFTSPDGWLMLASVGSAWLVALVVRRPQAIAISTLVFGAIVVAFVLGLLPTGSAGNTFILMTTMAAALIPASRSRGLNLILLFIAVLQIGIAWASAFSKPVILDWIHALNGALGLA